MNRRDRRSLGERGPQHPTVQIAYLHPGSVSDAFMASVLRLRDYELTRTRQLVGVASRRARTDAIAKSRNELTAAFLHTDTEWLLFIDGDMGFPPATVQLLLAAADPSDRPIIGALCFSHRTVGYDEETNAEIFAMAPTIQMWQRDEDGRIVHVDTIADYPRDTVCKVHGTGAACLLIHRSVLERMVEVDGPHWWTRLPDGFNEPLGEDTSFCVRAQDLDVSVHVHTGVRTSHDKGGVFLTEQAWDAQQQPRGAADLVPVDMIA